MRILTGLLSRPAYAQIVYLTSPAARPIITRAAANLPAAQQARVAIRDLLAPHRSRQDPRQPETPGTWSTAAPATPARAPAPDSARSAPCPASSGPGPRALPTRRWSPANCG